jgi:hypothetical protein
VTYTAACGGIAALLASRRLAIPKRIKSLHQRLLGCEQSVLRLGHLVPDEKRGCRVVHLGWSGLTGVRQCSSPRARKSPRLLEYDSPRLRVGGGKGDWDPVLGRMLTTGLLSCWIGFYSELLDVVGILGLRLCGPI